MEKISGMWKNKTKDGKTYLKGSFLGLNIIVLPNTSREEGSNQPHYILYLEQKQDKTSFEQVKVQEEEL